MPVSRLAGQILSRAPARVEPGVGYGWGGGDSGSDSGDSSGWDDSGSSDSA